MTEAHRDRQPAVAERPRQYAAVEVVYAVCDRLARFFRLYGGDDEDFEERDHQHGQQQRDHQVDRDRPREIGQEVAHHARHGEEDRIEDHADADRGQQQRREELPGALDRREPARVAAPEVVEVAVDHHDRIVDDHTQHHDQRREGHRVERDAAQVHDSHRDEGRQRDGDGRHDGRPQREEEHHHQDDDGHGDEQVAQERVHRVAHDLGLVGDALHLDVRGELGRNEFVQHFVHVTAVLHDVEARLHLHRQHDAAMAVVADVAVRVVVFAYDARHVLHAQHIPLGGAPDDLLGDLPPAGQRRRDVDGRFGLGVADRPAHRGQSLRGERGREDFFADAVGRQPFMVGVDRDLLLLHAVRAQVRDRLDAAQAVAQVVHVAFQFAVRPRVGFKRDEQRRGVAEVVVGDHGRNARRQLRLECHQAVLDL